MHIKCPHCLQAIEVVATQVDDLTCPLCGSSWQFSNQSTAAWTPSGKRLGKYELFEQLGVGAFGAVYKARDTELDRLVAIKLPRAGNLGSGGEADRFLREARSAAQLRHPGIVAVYDIGESEGVPFIVSVVLCQRFKRRMRQCGAYELRISTRVARPNPSS